MSPLSSWQYSSCFRKGQIRQLLRTLTDYFYVSSSSLVVWAVDGQRAIHRIPKQFTIFVSLDISKITSEKRSTFIYIICKKLSWPTIHFIMRVCAVIGRANGSGKITSWSIKTSRVFLHGSEDIMMAVVNFYQASSALSSLPLLPDPTQTQTGNRMRKKPQQYNCCLPISAGKYVDSRSLQGQESTLPVPSLEPAFSA